MTRNNFPYGAKITFENDVLLSKWHRKKEIRVFPQDQAAFHVGYAEDLRRGLEESSAYWRTIEVVGVQLAYILWRKQYNHQSS